MTAPRVLVLRAAGINCERELCHAFELAGAGEVQVIHVRRLAEKPELLDSFGILAIPGGFSYGDDVAAGKVLAVELRCRLGDSITKFVDRGGLVFGVCNGFQVLVATGLLPGFAEDSGEQTLSLAANDSGHFVDRWTTVVAPETRCRWIPEAGSQLELPVAHGEGKLIASDARLERLIADGQVALRYTAASNPNGSTDDIAGICDPTGRILGLMPHPERHILALQHPRWTREGLSDAPDGLAMFRCGIKAAVEDQH